MHLKQIEMENFKSFGGKITVPLMEGYTAVTGPNGSGKSNISDAILFVLGPKSPKAVRAGRLTDLIFNGGNTKKKAPFTKVSLVFDNKDRMMPWDDDEVKLTRYVKLAENMEDYYSYFYINDQKSTLTEFDNLLTKARISADGYNFVQQGDILHIVQMGNVERRRVVDSISGIASFDADIAKAGAEKAETTTNLDRVNIIVGELDVEVKKLEKDCEVARKYVDLKDTLDMAKAQMSHRKLQMEEASMESQNEQIDRLSKKIETDSEEKKNLEKQYSDNEDALKAKEDEIAAKIGPEYKELKDKIENVKIDFATKKDIIERMQADIEEQTNFKNSYEESINENKNAIKSLEESRDNLKVKLSVAEDEKKSLQKEEKEVSNLISSAGGEHKKLQQRLDKLDADSKEYSDKLLASQARFAKAESASEEAHGVFASLDEKIQGVDFEIKDSKWTLDQLKAEAGPSMEDYGAKVLEAKRKESELEKQEGELEAARRRIDGEYNALSAEKKVSERIGQTSRGVETILSLRDRGEMNGIFGTIQELATVDKRYETALSVAAGNKMQAVVVEDDEVAAKAIEYLKKQGLGRVTFLPLTKMIGGKPRAKAIMSEKESEGYAIDLIDFNQKYYNAFWYVLGDTLVVKNMDVARRIMGGIRMVTVQGELFEASGAMVGGTINQQNMLKFGASSEDKLTELGNKLRQATEALESCRQQLKQVRDELRALDDDMRKNTSSGMEQREQIAGLKAKVQELEKTKKGMSEELSEARDKMNAADGELADARDEFSKISGKVTEINEERDKVKDRIAEIAPAELQERIQSVRDKLFSAGETIADLTMQIGGAETEIAGYVKQNESLQMQLDSVLASIDDDNKTIETNKDDMERAKIELEALRKIEDEMDRGVEDLRLQKEELLSEKFRIEGSIREKATAIENANASIESFRAQVLVIQQQIEVYRAEVEAITFEVAQPIPSEEELRRTIRNCENKIDDMGNVNLRAIDDYDEKKARLDTLLEQVDSLTKHIKDLTGLVDSLTEKKKGLFMQSYDAIDQNFKRIYAELSEGGEAFMGLENPDDPFLGGLTINAKPRNGKLLRLEALSGGEKSLTALSFILAIQEYQPSPFYLFDEVDSALDAINSEIVAKKVKENSARAQFLQVSHHKIALAQADRLIGVTRPPSGISKIIMQPDLEEFSKLDPQSDKKEEF